MRRREFIFALGGAAVALAGPLQAAAQDYANRAVTLVANFPPGGSTDAMARILREPLSQALGQNIVIDNRGGAGGTTGAAAVANARPDGYTLLLSVNSALTTNRFLQKNFPFDAKTAFAPHHAHLGRRARARRASVATGARRDGAHCIRENE